MSTARMAEPRRRARAGTYLVFFALFALALAATHAFMLRLPFHWDEAGQFVPAALDLLRDGDLVPHSAVPNAHPPGVMVYLAAVWRVFGYSVEATRAAMLLLASLAMLAAFLLAIELARGAPGAPAFAAAVFLLASPVFYAQAAMVHLDMPAMLFTSLALLWFFQERLLLAVLACVVLGLTRETGLVVPLVFALWLAREGRWRAAGLFILPAVPVTVWLIVLEQRTGHLFGNQAFTDYNLVYLLHPVRLAAALARRLHYLFLADFHWVGTAAITLAWRQTRFFGSRAWKIAWLTVAAHAAAFTLLGGAVLERYLLPVLPVLYAAMASAMMFLRPRVRYAAVAVLTGGLAAGHFWNAPYPAPPENTVAWTDAVRVQREAAAFLSSHYSGTPIATAWPLAAVLARPELGYVARALAIKELPDFHPRTLDAVDWDETPVVVLFSRSWDPKASAIYRNQRVRALWSRYWGWKPDVMPAEMHIRGAAVRIARWSRGGQWVEVYEKPALTVPPSPLASGIARFPRRPTDLPRTPARKSP